MIAILIGLVIGIGLPMQTSINSRLRSALGSPFLASLVSFGIGTIFLAVMTLIDHRSLLVSGSFIGQQPFWLWLGGLLGVIYLTGNIILFPKLGSVQTVIFPVLGQILAGLLIDDFGLFYSPISQLTVVRGLGALLVLAGVTVTVAGNSWVERITGQAGLETVEDEEPKASHLMLWRLFGVLAGMLSATQTAVNGHLGEVLGSKIQAAYVSFLVGTLSLIVIVLVLRPSLSFQHGNGKTPWWMWIGGLLGALFVLGNVYLVPIIGTGFAVIIVLIGLMIGSLLIDQFGWLSSEKNPVTLLQLGGLLIMVVGVMIIRLL
ncbi:DMT family transporter [Lactobacillus sp. LC28-10]|uniref:DMT family transporter n=1 Tax=Secundilactobacillus angelensis TaxID=2722706 RepID=A0ABX1L397_9LACO|nr:DMT family transporter [Secundilactobacillus angelensis]MCH5462689.1 DMT family transporter [Secundilactobacillus angelensis]NLR18801.1 DMT family transporter [Secundilactobacillus angelensis]